MALALGFVLGTMNGAFSLQETTGAATVDVEETRLAEGYSQDLDVNQDTLPDATLTLIAAENGIAEFKIEKGENACYQVENAVAV